jgi:hypothetical protein
MVSAWPFNVQWIVGHDSWRCLLSSKDANTICDTKSGWWGLSDPGAGLVLNFWGGAEKPCNRSPTTLHFNRSSTSAGRGRRKDSTYSGSSNGRYCMMFGSEWTPSSILSNSLMFAFEIVKENARSKFIIHFLPSLSREVRFGT